MAKINYIQITRECNQKCIICSNPPSGLTLSLAKIKQALQEYKAEACTEVILTGGEPTTHPELLKIINYCEEIGIRPRIITNGQKLANKNFLADLIQAGLADFNVSIYSHEQEINEKLTATPGSFANLLAALQNLGEYAQDKKIRVNLNIVINKFNADHLLALVQKLMVDYPFVRHFVFNNLDCEMGRVNENPEVIPDFNDFELELFLALEALRAGQRTFRVERVPLCYLTGHEAFSTETRKIVKEEERTIVFLDQRGIDHQTHWRHNKADCCAVCHLNEICAGYYSGYKSQELYPVFIDKEKIIAAIKAKD